MQQIDRYTSPPEAESIMVWRPDLFPLFDDLKALISDENNKLRRQGVAFLPSNSGLYVLVNEPTVWHGGCELSDVVIVNQLDAQTELTHILQITRRSDVVREEEDFDFCEDQLPDRLNIRYLKENEHNVEHAIRELACSIEMKASGTRPLF